MRFVALVPLFLVSGLALGQSVPKASAQRMEERINALSKFGTNEKEGVSRVAYSEADINARAYVMGVMRELGLVTRVDAAGNIIGRRGGKNDKLPAIAFGSHIDSVPEGGNYDGDVGSMGALECVQLLNEAKITTSHPLEVLIFQNEEGGLIGSEAMCGILDTASLKLVTHSGKTIAQGIADIGGKPDSLAKAIRKKGDLKAFLELHIEQGGTLASEGIAIGVVEGIVGINQWVVTIEGKANHAGTTPMNQRNDALVAAANFILLVNRLARSTPGRQVATVGKIHAEPGAPNVIPGKVELSLEIRDLSHDVIVALFEKIKAATDGIQKTTGTTFTFKPTNENLPAITDRRIQDMVTATAKKLGLTYKSLPSGAGHDTQDMVRLAPAGMIFVPSKDGISHSPLEYTSPQDMANGVDVLVTTILAIDKAKF